jgi:hypothetical protein
VVVVAAGDIACPASYSASATQCRQAATATVVRHLAPTTVLTLGDDQYERGSLADYRSSYAATWGTVLDRTRPTPGNHDYETSGASGYYGYFGARAGSSVRGYYSVDIGAWHVVSLNGTCAAAGGCGHGSSQEAWLRNDLAGHRTRCVLAYWHQPRWSSSIHGSDAAYGAFWDDLYSAHADVVLNGHDHVYERFGRMTPAGHLDGTYGIREFVVGTGGRSHYAFRSTLAPNSQFRDNAHFGVLKLVLGATGYAWRFYAVGGTTTDAARTTCSA